jgi:hypothetical protein
MKNVFETSIDNTQILKFKDGSQLSYKKGVTYYMGKQIVLKLGLGNLKVSSFIKLGKVLNEQKQPINN